MNSRLKQQSKDKPQASTMENANPDRDKLNPVDVTSAEAGQRQEKKSWRKRLSRVTRGLTWALLFVLVFWSMGALFNFEPLPHFLRASFGFGFLIASIAIFFRFQRRHVAKSIVFAMFVVVFIGWLMIRPHLDHKWMPLHETIARVTIEDGQVTIDNLRWTTYKTETDFSIDYETRKFKLNQVEEVWYFVQRFTDFDFLAHTYLAFGVRTESGMEYFGVSAEVRCDADEIYSPTKGLYKQYEIMYTISDERDSIGYRTHCRTQDRLYMYRCNTTPAQAQDMFQDIAARINQLEERPEFYHTFTNNCTTNIVRHANPLATKRIPYFNPRVIFPGYSARTAYNLGIIGKRGESFEALQARSRVDEIARQFELDENFSTNVRQAMPK